MTSYFVGGPPHASRAVADPLPGPPPDFEATDVAGFRAWEQEIVEATGDDAPGGVPDGGDRLRGALVGAAIGSLFGYVALNGSRSIRVKTYAAGPMNVGMTAAFVGAGAVLGAIAGATRGGNPVAPQAPAPPGITTPGPTHPAFA